MDAPVKATRVVPSVLPSATVSPEWPEAFIHPLIHSCLHSLPPSLKTAPGSAPGTRSHGRLCRFQRAYLEKTRALFSNFYNLPEVAQELEAGRRSCLAPSSVPASTPPSSNRSRKVTHCGCKLALALILAYSKTLDIFPNGV